MNSTRKNSPTSIQINSQTFRIGNHLKKRFPNRLWNLRHRTSSMVRSYPVKLPLRMCSQVKGLWASSNRRTWCRLDRRNLGKDLSVWCSLRTNQVQRPRSNQKTVDLVVWMMSKTHWRNLIKRILATVKTTTTKSANGPAWMLTWSSMTTKLTRILTMNPCSKRNGIQTVRGNHLLRSSSKLNLSQSNHRTQSELIQLKRKANRKKASSLTCTCSARLWLSTT